MKPALCLTCLVSLFMFATSKKDAVTFSENYIPINQCQSHYYGSLTCCLDSVLQDSRCPIYATFIWAGIVVVRFKVDNSNAPHTITLATYKFPPYIQDTTVSGFKIELVNLSAQKEIEKPFDYNDYIAKVKITKL